MNYDPPETKIFRGPIGTNEWNGKTSLVRSAHTHTSSLPNWTLPRSRASRIYTAIRGRLNPHKPGTLSCPSCATLRKHRELVFVDLGDSLRGPMCRGCLSIFISNRPAASGYSLYLFSATNIEDIPLDVQDRATNKIVETLRNLPVPLKNLI